MTTPLSAEEIARITTEGVGWITFEETLRALEGNRRWNAAAKLLRRIQPQMFWALHNHDWLPIIAEEWRRILTEARALLTDGGSHEEA